MKKLLVHYEGWGERWLLGTLADNGSDLLFEYSALALRQGLELSPRHLKLRVAAYGNFPAHLQRLPGLIADALPDGWGMLLMDRLFRKQGLVPAALSPLERLAFIGQRAIGALSFEPAQAVDWTDGKLSLLDLARESQTLVAGRDTDALKQLAVLGGSPQGARPKVLVHYRPDTQAMSTVAAAGFTPWLVKFQAQGEHKEVCAIECLYADMARRCGLEMPETRHFDLDRRLATFAIARFDREGDFRVPVHTLAGALRADFRQPGAVDYTTFLRATRLFTQDQREVQRAFERAVFNVVFHNRDDHPKNLSFRLGQDRRWRLAPCYDLSFSPGPGGEHQMDVCGEGRAVTKALLLKLAEQGGLEKAWAEQAVARIAGQAGALEQLASNWPIRRATGGMITAAVEANRARLV